MARLATAFLLMALAAATVLWIAGPRLVNTPAFSQAHQGDDCPIPLTYRMGEVDPRFGLSSEALREVTAEAAALWEDLAPRPLFRYDPAGELLINLTYDERQGTWEAQQRAQEALEEVRARHAALVEAHEAREHALRTARARYEDQLAYVERRLERHNSVVVAVNTGEIERTPERVKALERESEAITALRQQVDAQYERVERLRRQFNARVSRLNQMTETLNRQVRRYNDQFARGGGYNKGVYLHKRSNRAVRRSITVYQFKDRADLRQVLAHELGHALGIDHVSDPAALMHYQLSEHNTGLSRLTAADRQALRAVCGW